MRTYYNIIAGQSLERLTALSDGIFAVAMTLLVLDLRVPVSSGINFIQPLWASGAIQHEQALWNELFGLAPNILTYLMSFLTLGIFWVGQQTQLNHFARSDRNLAWIQLAFLLAVTLLPFSTGLLSAFFTYRLALVLYWFNIFLLGTMLFVSLRYAMRTGLMKDEITIEMRSALERRIIIAQALYAFGALLCIFSTLVSMAFIFLVQLNYVIAPRIAWLDRL
jgi:uncharacterized membrane protein